MTGRARANGEGSIFPRGNGFAAYVWVTTPAGTRTRKYVYGQDRETVHRKWVELHRTAAQRPVATRVPTVGQWLETWLAEEVRPNLAPATAENYAMFVRLYIAPVLGSKRLDRLSVQDVQRWVNALRAQCQCCAQGKDAARPSRLRRCWPRSGSPARPAHLEFADAPTLGCPEPAAAPGPGAPSRSAAARVAGSDGSSGG